MDYGFYLPMRGPIATSDGIEAMARRGEELGFAYIAVPDHIVIPRDIESRYPYSESGEFRWGQHGDCLEQLAVLSFLAARTSRIRLLTSIMVVPHRNPVFTAKALATVDILSGGRLTVGCGVGWMREEFEAIGTPPFAERGRVADEYLRVFKELWTSDAPNFHGDYARFSDVVFLPQPVQKPHPPLWIGGESVPAMKRAARLGDGWYPINGNPRHPLDTLERYQEALGRLRGYAEDNDRDFADLDLGYAALRWGEDPGPGLLRGSAREIADDIARLADAGVRHLVLAFERATLDKTLERMEGFANEVIPLVGA